MKKCVSISDIALKCGVSRATVGHILSGRNRYKFKPETVELVRRTAAELNYRPNAYASALRNQENRIILCIVGDVCRHSDMEHLKRLEYELGKRNYNLLIQFLVDLSDEMKLEFMKKTIALPAGIAIWSLGFKEKQSMEQFKEIFANAPPTLSMTEELPGTKIDYIKILWGSPTIPMAVEHFRQKGFHRIGCCCNDKSELSDIFTTAARQSGLEVKNYLEDRGVVVEYFDSDFIVLMFSPSLSLTEFKRVESVILSLPKKPSILTNPPKIIQPKKAMEISQALFSAGELVRVENALGRVLQNGSVSCPPAVSPIVPGEIIDQNVLKVLSYYSIEKVYVVKN